MQKEKVKVISSPIKLFKKIQNVVGSFILLYYFVFDIKNVFDQIIHSTLLYSFIILILFLSHTWYHETFHNVTAKSLGYWTRKSCKHKICLIKGLIKSKHFFRISIMPFFVDLLIILLLVIFYHTQTFFNTLFIFGAVSSSSSDLYIAILAIPYLDNNKYVLRYKKPSSFSLYKRMGFHDN